MPAVAEVAATGAVVAFMEAATEAAQWQDEDTAAVRSQFEELGAALSQCAEDATAMAAMVIGVTVSVRRRSARLLSEQLRQGPIIVAAAATTLMETGFARATDLFEGPAKDCNHATPSRSLARRGSIAFSSV